ncbi:unnamed protein product [Moneuplotes crassus]|uniref:Uncharacterized protein n=1 Tax=Euplotes crassus TaxID=5936 RepID=A0AAD1Y2A9_EUPCR|nr:unnamed protein product [Moneuplotes crassus]
MKLPRINVTSEQDSKISTKVKYFSGIPILETQWPFLQEQQKGWDRGNITSRAQLRNAHMDCIAKKSKSFLMKIFEISNQFCETDRRFAELEAQIPQKEIDQLNRSAVEYLKKLAVPLILLNILLYIIKALKSPRTQQDHDQVVANFLFLVLSCAPIYFILLSSIQEPTLGKPIIWVWFRTCLFCIVPPALEILKSSKKLAKNKILQTQARILVSSLCKLNGKASLHSCMSSLIQQILSNRRSQEQNQDAESDVCECKPCIQNSAQRYYELFNFIGMSFGHLESFIENNISSQELHDADIKECTDGIKRFKKRKYIIQITSGSSRRHLELV